MIKSLDDIPCTNCEYAVDCVERCRRSEAVMVVCDAVMRGGWDRVDCPIYIAIRVDKNG